MTIVANFQEGHRVRIRFSVGFGKWGDWWHGTVIDKRRGRWIVQADEDRTYLPMHLYQRLYTKTFQMERI